MVLLLLLVKDGCLRLLVLVSSMGDRMPCVVILRVSLGLSLSLGFLLSCHVSDLGELVLLILLLLVD